MACRFPGANDYDAFWENLKHGISSIKEIPPERWNIRQYYSSDINETNKSISKWYGLVDNFDKFDNDFFNISPRESQYMDPQQRLLLEETWHCIEDSGVALKELREKKTDVYVGVSDWDYLLNAVSADTNVYSMLGNHSSILSNRISHVFGLRGSSLSIDTACSSSLFAADIAKDSLLSSMADYALVACASVHCHPFKYIAFSNARITSPDGKCKTFDKDANGFVLGDGIAVLLLQKLEEAVRGKRNIYGIIKGIGTNHGGSAATLTSPVTTAQAEVITAAYEKAGVSPEAVDYIEAHGTGTSLGDPIEVEALTQVFRRYTGKKQFCQIGSVKTNIGHTGGAAGMAGIIKVLLMMRSRQIPPSLNFNTPNPVINFDASPFRVATKLCEWKNNGEKSVLRSGVSAFGFGGANAHMVLEEPPPMPAVQNAIGSSSLFILSANSEKSLVALLENWRRFAQSSRYHQSPLHDICATLGSGRESFSYRFGCMVDSHDELQNFLNAAPGVFPKRSRPSLCLRIGEGDFNGFEDIQHLLAGNIPFRREIERIEADLKKLNVAKAKIRGLHRKTWGDDNHLYQFVAGYAFLKSFLETGGIVPDLVAGETRNSGFWTALALSGMIKREDALAFLSGIKNSSEIEFTRPDIPFFDPVSRKTIRPYYFDAEYLRRLSENIDIPKDAAAFYLSKAESLLENQFTFKKFIDEWDAVLSKTGRDIGKMIRDNKGFEKERRIPAVIIANCIRKLNRKWSFSEQRVTASPEFYEMIDLITDHLMPKETVIDLLADENPDYEAAAAVLNKNQKKLDIRNYYSIIKNQKLNEIGDIEGWLRNTEGAVICDPDQMLCFDFGRINAFGSAEESVTADMGDDPAVIIEKTMLKLWLRGVDVEIKNLYPDGTFQKVPLPVYPFKGERHWLPGVGKQALEGVGKVAELHPLLHRNTSDLSEQRFSSTFTGGEFFLSDHVVKGRKVLPGVAHLEMARAAFALAAEAPREGRTAIVLKNVVWIRPIVSTDGSTHVNIGLVLEENGEIGYQIYAPSASGIGSDDNAEQVYSQGTALFNTVEKTPVQDIESLMAGCDRDIVSSAEHYKKMKNAGLDLGSGFQAIETVYTGEKCALAKLNLSSDAEGTENEFVLHPGLLDSALQAAVYLFPNFNQFELSIPFNLKKIEIFRGTASPMWSFARPGNGVTPASSEKVQTFDVDLYDNAGSLCARVEALSFRVPKFEADAAMGTLMLRPLWTEQIADGKWTDYHYHKHFVLFCGTDEVSEVEMRARLGDAEMQFFASDSQLIDQRFQNCAVRTFEAIQAILKEKPEGKVLIQLVTTGRDDSPLIGLSGLLKTAHLENPKLICQLIETDDGVENIAEKLEENGACPEDAIVRYRDSKRWVADIDEVSAPMPVEWDIPWKDNGVYLITGGTGGLGLIFAREIAARVENAVLILTGRSEPGGETKARIETLKETGARVEFFQTDVCNRQEVGDLIESILKAYGILSGIIHSAGVISDNFIINKSVGEFEKVLAPKVTGLVNLDEATQKVPLDLFVIFSSIAGSVGNIGQADYACANAFAGTYAAYRNRLVTLNRRKGRTVSIHWPLWKEGGMSVGPETEKMMMQNMGMIAMGTAAGIHAFHRAISSGHSNIMIIEGDLSRIRRKMLSAPPPLIRPETEKTALFSPGAVIGDTDLFDKVRSMLIQDISGAMSIREEKIDGKVELEKYGFDSISLTEFSNRLNQKFGLELAPTLFFEYPTIDSLTRYLVNDHRAIFTDRFAVNAAPAIAPSAPVVQASGNAPAVKRPRQRFASPLSAQRHGALSSDPVAIVGISGRFPMAEDIDQFWENLAEGKHCISEIPKDRWDWEAFYGDPLKDGNRTDIKWGGFIDGVADFDPGFFGISPREAELMDPQQRLLMLYAWKAIEDAGYPANRLSGTNTGIFIGTGGSEYSEIIARVNAPIEGYTSTGNVPSVGPNRLSYFLDVHGPSEPVETSCSSSLVAIHRAVEAMENGSCDMAIVGGVNTILTPGFHISFGKAGMLSKDGKCKTFSDTADGYVRGEGVGMLFLRKLSQAIRSNDHIYGIIRGTAVNHGGRANSLTAPNPKAQTEVMKLAYRKAGIDPRRIGYIETHGTGTNLGDPIEIEGLKAAFYELYAKTGASDVAKAHCGLGSVKTNIGHTELAAGVAGVIKVLLQIKHKTIVKSLHCDTVNPYIRLENSPFYIAGTSREWRAPTDATGSMLPRIAGISSFGFGGANAHVVIEEYVRERAVEILDREEITGRPYIFVLSAKNEHRLKDYAGVMADYLIKTKPNDSDLVDIAFTSQTGRVAMKERLAMIAGTVDELTGKLKHFIAGGENNQDRWHRGSARPDKENLTLFEADEELRDAVDKWIERGKYAKLTSLWVKGLDFDWYKLYGKARPRRISLPTYPFEKARCWVDGPTGTNRGAGIVDEPSRLHPLLHRNTSDFTGQRFSSTFTGEDDYLADHAATGGKMLPTVAHLEMARAAALLAAGIPEEEPTNLVLENVAWAAPVTVAGDSVDVHIRLFPEKNGEIAYEIYTRSGQVDGAPVVHGQGVAVLNTPGEVPALNIASLMAQCDPNASAADESRDALAQTGPGYGTRHGGIESVHVGEGRILSRLSLPASNAGDPLVLRPALIDLALRASMGLMNGRGKPGPLLPVALDRVEVWGGHAPVWAYARHGKGRPPAERTTGILDIDLCDEQGNVCVRMKGLSFKSGGSETAQTQVGAMMLKRSWREKSADGTVDPAVYAKQVVALCEPSKAFRQGAAGSLQGVEMITLKSGKRNIDRRFSACALQLFEKIQAIAKAKPEGNILLQVVVSGKEDRRVFAGLSGLLKTAHLEQPKISGQLIEIENEVRIRPILDENSRLPEDAHIRYKAGKRLVSGFEEIEIVPEKSAMAWKDNGVYLITGGTGGLGHIFAKEIARRVKNPVLILTGRFEPGAGRKARIDELKGLGARVEFKQSDVARKRDVENLIKTIVRDHGGLSAVLHAAGIIRDDFIIRKTKETFTRVLAPKVAGIVHLDEATRNLNLDFFVAFSSGAGAHGNAGQVDYACANAFMDAYAARRNDLVKSKKRYGKTLSINWAPWKEGGMPMDELSQRLMTQSSGMVPMQTETGIQAFYLGLSSNLPQMMPMEGDVGLMRRYMSEFPTQAALHPVSAEGPPVAPELLGTKTEHRLKILFEKITKVRIADIDSDEPFESYGVDSLMIARFNQTFERIFIDASKTLFYEYRTLGELVRYLVSQYPQECMRWCGLAGEPAPSGPPPAFEVPASGDDFPVLTPLKGVEKKLRRHGGMVWMGTREPIAVIGVSGRYPGAENTEEYWENLKAGKDCIQEIPEERWPLEGFYHPDPDQAVAQGKSYSKWGGFIDGFADFDPLFFNISPKEAMNMDPQERLFIQACWEVIEDAGYTRDRLTTGYHKRIGVFAGITKTGYDLYGPDLWRRGEKVHPFTSFSSLANRVSFLFDFKGPSLPVDTMCSSSLTAVHEACEHLYREDCEMAVAGGVNLYLHPSAYTRLCAMRMLTTGSKSKSFGRGGDGFLPGEGVGAVLLKRLSKAEADRDPIYAVIRGTGINHGGRTSGYTVPSPVAQGELVRGVMEKAGVKAQEISYIEAHGTGTELGDPIEITGLSQAFEKDTDEKRFCAIGSVKSNIGHLEASAGIAGLTKIILQMQHEKIVPSLHARELNPNIDFTKTPFVVPQGTGDWKRPEIDGRKVPRIAGLSSFGAGGANAHVIIEEYTDKRPKTEVRRRGDKGKRPAIFVLSAKNEDRLKAYADKMEKYLQSRLASHNSGLSLADVAYTTQTGREAMKERLAIIVSSVKVLRDKLKRFVAGEEKIEDLFRTGVKRDKATAAVFQADEDLQKAIDAWIAKGKYSKLVNLWVNGLAVDWHKLYEGQANPMRISLPAYPFVKERYWIDGVNTRGLDQDAGAVNETVDMRIKGPAPLLYTEISSKISTTDTGPRNEAPTELMTFEEYLDEQAVSIGSGFGINTLVCILTKPENRKVVSNALAKRAPETRVVFISIGDAYKKESRTHYRVSRTDGSTYIKAFDAIVTDYGAIEAGLYMAALEDPEAVTDYSPIVYTIQAIAGLKLESIRFLLAARQTGGAERCYPESWIGFERSMGLVMPHMQLGVVLRETETAAGAGLDDWVECLWREIRAERIESSFHFGNQRQVLRFRQTRVEEGKNLFRPNETYLLTGGCGGLGVLFARHLLKKHSVNLVLTGRSPLDDKKRLLLKSIGDENPDARIDYLQADICDSGAMAEGMARQREQFGRIVGVIHAAGIESTQNILEKDMESFHEILRSKTEGTMILDDVLKEAPPDFVCYFSSSAAILGDFGSCDYAIANRFLMAYANYKNDFLRKGTNIVINWPLWKAGGMGFGSDDRTQMYLKSSGQRFLETEEGLFLFDRLLSRGRGQHLVLAGEPSRIHRFLGLSEKRPWFLADRAMIAPSAGKGRRKGMDRFSVEECLQTDLKDHVGRLLNIPVEQLDPDVNLAEFGFDSISLTDFGSALSDHYGTEVSPAIFFEYNTIDKLVTYFTGRHKEIIDRFYSEPAPEKEVSGWVPSKVSGRQTDVHRFGTGRTKERPKRFPECVGLYGEGSRRPCFWIHPLTGSVEPYIKIAQNLNIGQPFFGIQSRGFCTNHDFLNSIGEMAGYYIEIITAMDPEGPYQLAGFSMGGVIAYEMARQLQSRGLEVRNLLLLEPPFPSGAATIDPDEIALRTDTILTTCNFFLYSHLKKAIHGDGKKFGDIAFGKSDTGKFKGDDLIDHLANECREKGVKRPAELIGRTIRNMSYAFAYNKKALAFYTVRPLLFPDQVDIYYFTKKETDILKPALPDQFGDLLNDTRKLLGEALTHDEAHYRKWKEMLSGLETVRVPSKSHFDLMTDKMGLPVLIDKCRSIYLQSESGGNRVAGTNGNIDSRNKAVAIVGVSGRFPMARDITEFWTNLAEGKDCISEIPEDRWDWRALYGDPLKEANKTNVNVGGFIDGIGDFDPMFFGISPREAEWMDPHQRLLMLYVWKAIEDAGYSATEIAGTRTGMYIGIASSGYGEQVLGASPLEGFYGTGVIPAMGPNRMSYFLDLHGPSEPVDTTCSSSLVAICKAAAAIESGVCDAAIAGGVNIIINPAFHVSLDRLGMLSKDGRCKTFSDKADGYGRSEGVGMLYLKRLEDAEKSGDHIYGIIRGGAVNHGGRANSLTAPNPKAQVALLTEAYGKAGIDPGTIGYIETHGTGTELGDPIEIDALKSAFDALRRTKGAADGAPVPCGLGSVKSNIGHAELAAGVAGVIKTLLQLKHRTIVKSLHCDTVNPYIKLEGSPFYIATTAEPWKAPPDASGNKLPRRAGISSFGAGGANAHLIIEEYQDDSGRANPLDRKPDDGAPAIFVLSAKNEERLKAHAVQMEKFVRLQLENKEDRFDIADIAYTLQVGREAMEERLAVILGSLDELADKLARFVSGENDMDGIFRGNAKRDKKALSVFKADEAFEALFDTWIERQDYSKLLSLWVKGLVIDWNQLYGKFKPRRISLPTYPFAEERYWLEAEKGPGKESKGKGDRIKGYRPDAHPKTALPARPVAQAVLTTFEEYLQERKRSVGSGVRFKTLVCVLRKPENRKVVEKRMKKLAPALKVLFISQGDSYGKSSRRHYRVSRTDGKTYQMAFADIARDHGAAGAVFYMPATEGIETDGVYTDILFIIQGLAVARLTHLRFLLAAPLGNGPARCYAESWIGFERSLRLVMPKMQFGVIYQKAGTAAQAHIADWLDILWRELHVDKIESALYDDEKRYLYRNRETKPEDLKSLLKPKKTYLITGGCGGLGSLVARYLAKAYAVNLVLSGRSPMDDRIRLLIKGIEKEGRGSRVIYLEADICDRAAMRKGLDDAEKQFGKIDGVIHAAGIESASTIIKKDAESFTRVLRPKVDGCLALNEALTGETLDFICYFSSASAILGDFGACDYAIANRFMAAYADYKNGLHPREKHIVINWPLWKAGGMGFTSDSSTQLYLKSSGQRFLETEEGLDMFDRLLPQEKTQHLVLAGDSSHIHRFLGLSEHPPSATEKPPAGPGLFPGGRRKEMKGFTVSQCLEYDLKDLIGRLLKISSDQLDSDANLADFGFDSISFVELASALTRFYGMEITPSIFFDHPTIEKLVRYFERAHKKVVEYFYKEPDAPHGDSGISVPEQNIPWKPTRRKRPRFVIQGAHDPFLEDIAIIGMSGRFPGARNIDEMWKILLEGKDAITEIPIERFNWRQHFGEKLDGPDGIGSNRCGVLSGVDEFDPSFFEISPKEAKWMDPRQRLLLEESWKALEDAGYGPLHLKRNKMGLFVGMETGDYRLLSENEKGITSDHEGISAVRLAYFLNFGGPAMAINTSCSSGLVAAHQACQSLRNRECDTAIAAGVNLMLSPEAFKSLGRSGMLSPSGKCSAFDRQADGMVPGEAVASIVLKRLTDAEKDQDSIYAVIKGSGINYDGKSNGITVPNGSAQAGLMKTVYDQYGIDPGKIEYIVTHGTGTKLGDPVEINALYDAFKGYTDKQRFCALTSTKTNFGHTFAASGLVSLISLVQALRHETIPASLNCVHENDFIKWNESPFFVNVSAKPWTTGEEEKRIGAVSAFGMSGTNAHMVIEGPAGDGVAPDVPGDPFYLMMFSAKKRTALAEKIVDMVSFFRDNTVELTDLAHICRTLSQGRHHFAYRNAVVVQDPDDAAHVLNQLKCNETSPKIFYGEVPHGFTGQRTIRGYVEEMLKQAGKVRSEKEKYRDILYGLAELYCQGYEISQGRHDSPRGRFGLRLPTYPFAKERHWISEIGQPSPESAKRQPAQRPIGKTPLLSGPPSNYPMLPEKRARIKLDPLTDRQFPAADKKESPRRPIVLSPVFSPTSVELKGRNQTEHPPAIQNSASTASLLQRIKESLAEALYMNISEIDPDRPFMELGMDSIIGVEWIKAVNEQFDVNIAAIKIYDHPNLREFTEFLESELDLNAVISHQPPSKPAPPASLEELLLKVQQGEVDIDQADQFFNKFSNS